MLTCCYNLLCVEIIKEGRRHAWLVFDGGSHDASDARVLTATYFERLCLTLPYRSTPSSFVRKLLEVAPTDVFLKAQNCERIVAMVVLSEGVLAVVSHSRITL
jgi:hypothetical protein